MKREASGKVKQELKRNPQLKDVYRNINKDLQKIEVKLHELCRHSNPMISEIGDYIFQKTGKRLRPALLTLCANLFDYQGDAHILMGALVETIHSASLIHDDIIDNSARRRGKRTVHARWGPNITVLLGDFLYIKTIGRSLESGYRDITQTLIDITSQMIEGELQEYYLSGNLKIEEHEYLDILNKKTASLFSASCRIGGILGRATEKNLARLSNFGTYIGLSFQIIDDLLDYTGDEQILGKPVLSDMKEGRITLPLIYTMNHDGTKNRDLLLKIFRKERLEREAQIQIINMVKSNGALDYTFSKARYYAQKAEEIVSGLPESVYRDSLSVIPPYILSRNK
jgi:octaprenyl-diphosphate synthase